jgi:HSP20 family protein
MTFYFTPTHRMAGLHMPNMRQAMERMMEESFAEPRENERELLLAVDVQDSDEGYEINALVPGLEADDLEIEIINNTVTLRGQFKSLSKENSKYLLSELPAGAFSRVITLPTDVDAAKTQANLKNGVLTLNILKAEAHRPKTIKVTSV